MLRFHLSHSLPLSKQALLSAVYIDLYHFGIISNCADDPDLIRTANKLICLHRLDQFCLMIVKFWWLAPRQQAKRIS